MRQIKVNKGHKLFIYLHPLNPRSFGKKPVKLWSCSLYINSGQLQYFQICSPFYFLFGVQGQKLKCKFALYLLIWYIILCIDEVYNAVSTSTIWAWVRKLRRRDWPNLTESQSPIWYLMRRLGSKSDGPL